MGIPSPKRKNKETLVNAQVFGIGLPKDLEHYLLYFLPVECAFRIKSRVCRFERVSRWV